VARATGLPLAIYSRGWAVFSPDEVARLAEAIPTLRYWKDGQGDPRVFRRIMAKVGDRLTWIGGAGDDAAAVYAAIGIRCFTSSISGVLPALALAWGRAAMESDLAALNRLLDGYVHPLFALRARRRGYEVSAMKKARELLGRVSAGPVRPPLPALAPADEADLRSLLIAWRDFS
jgi:5-dehydro-4-deoxyglucarate dehydratase